MENGNNEQHHSRALLTDLVDRRLVPDQIKEIQSAEKDPDRFDQYVSILSERVPWPEQILLPIHEHLFIVAKDGQAITKAACGHEFGDWRINYKVLCRVRVRRSAESLAEIYEPGFAIDPALVDMREFICPGCGSLLEVDAVPLNYPVERDFFPDLKVFYEEWLGRPLPVDPGDYVDQTPALLRSWAAEPS